MLRKEWFASDGIFLVVEGDGSDVQELVDKRNDIFGFCEKDPMTMGQGSRITFNQYMLFVEVQQEGWMTAVRDTNLRKWHLQEHVNNEAEGKKLAVSKLLEILSLTERAQFEAANLPWKPLQPLPVS